MLGDTFNTVVKFLRRTPARVITKDEAAGYDNANGPGHSLSKYFNRVPTRPIERNNVSLTLKAFSVLGKVGYQTDTLLFQYNVSMSSDFYLIDIPLYQPLYQPTVAPFIQQITQAVLVVRFHFNGVTYRYLVGSGGTIIGSKVGQYTTPYNKQLIKANCTFELYLVAPLFNVACGVGADVKFTTSLLTEPSSSDDTGIIVNATGIPIANIGFNLPVNLPVDNTVAYWLNN